MVQSRTMAAAAQKILANPHQESALEPSSVGSTCAGRFLPETLAALWERRHLFGSYGIFRLLAPGQQPCRSVARKLACLRYRPPDDSSKTPVETPCRRRSTATGARDGRALCKAEWEKAKRGWAGQRRADAGPVTTPWRPASPRPGWCSAGTAGRAGWPRAGRSRSRAGAACRGRSGRSPRRAPALPWRT